MVSYGRWSPTGGGRTWRFDCTYVHPLMLVNVTYLLRLFTIYMGKLVGPWFGQLVPKIQDWYISSRICIYYLYKSGILHNLCTPQTSTVRHYWPICYRLLIAISVDCRLTCCWTLDRYVGQCIGQHISWHVGWHSIACRLGQLSCNIICALKSE